MIGMKLEELTQEKIDAVFAALRSVMSCHWQAPKQEAVERALQKSGKLEYTSGGTIWTFKLAFVLAGGDVRVEIITNKELQGPLGAYMEEKARELKNALAPFSH
ncbi:hypothetical protein HYS54_03435 [Candidatus Micrarchaeota archaeon]|nr:hypothetical protein [Candidatus Micrarchaeota archaeon]